MLLEAYKILALKGLHLGSSRRPQADAKPCRALASPERAKTSSRSTAKSSSAAFNAFTALPGVTFIRCHPLFISFHPLFMSFHFLFHFLAIFAPLVVLALMRLDAFLDQGSGQGQVAIALHDGILLAERDGTLGPRHGLSSCAQIRDKSSYTCLLYNY